MTLTRLSNLRIPALILIVIGTALGIIGSVRSGAVALSLGTATYVCIKFFQSVPRRRIELIIPLGMCLVLATVALTLPHAK